MIKVDLFFELVRVAIGHIECMSHTPSDAEWQQLYEFAKKQTLVGLCFSGVQKLQVQQQIPPEKLYLLWMGMAAKIQQRNEIVNRQCLELGNRLHKKGFSCCILKGQGVAQYYVGPLRELRQSGDIDVYLWKEGLNAKENRKAVLNLAKRFDQKARGSAHHTAVHMFPDTEVELHYEASYLCNPWTNKRLQMWMKENVNPKLDVSLGCYIPSNDFNVVFLLAHIFRHYVSEGVGLRQMTDYYFTLRALNKKDNETLPHILRRLNMLKFASAVMWVMAVVFENKKQFDNWQQSCPWMICAPNERLGKKLLVHIMDGGNFGHYNEKTVMSKKRHIGMFVNQLTHDMHLAIDYPVEALWSPISMIREFLRIRL